MRRLGSPISLDLFVFADNTLVPLFFAQHRLRVLAEPRRDHFFQEHILKHIKKKWRTARGYHVRHLM